VTVFAGERTGVLGAKGEMLSAWRGRGRGREGERGIHSARRSVQASRQ
jgi:hypothetical protein